MKHIPSFEAYSTRMNEADAKPFHQRRDGVIGDAEGRAPRPMRIPGFDEFVGEAKSLDAKGRAVPAEFAGRVKIAQWNGDDGHCWAVTFDGRIVGADYDLTKAQAQIAMKQTYTRLIDFGVDGLRLGAKIDEARDDDAAYRRVKAGEKG